MSPTCNLPTLTFSSLSHSVIYKSHCKPFTPFVSNLLFPALPQMLPYVTCIITCCFEPESVYLFLLFIFLSYRFDNLFLSLLHVSHSLLSVHLFFSFLSSLSLLGLILFRLSDSPSSWSVLCVC
uniref:Uncharacterized protein n=1 Tax=Cacopsylla melanoneura TaxID=428564 RepID=A0A8D9E362_9HEMI